MTSDKPWISYIIIIIITIFITSVLTENSVLKRVHCVENRPIYSG